ncbi:hypothetical protein [Halomonas sp. 141]|uniref:hypothetical protein n=1 Tax=Halomonas sp. 141 TaxID=2056666 RepID=UPI001E541C9B|nr:hypothetical protein [Halomonas sp. 141]
MDALILLQMLIAALIGVVVYTAIGVAPGTDETAVLAPVTLALVVAGIPLPVVLAFCMAAIVAKKFIRLHERIFPVLMIIITIKLTGFGNVLKRERIERLATPGAC